MNLPPLTLWRGQIGSVYKKGKALLIKKTAQGETRAQARRLLDRSLRDRSSAPKCLASASTGYYQHLQVIIPGALPLYPQVIISSALPLRVEAPREVMGLTPPRSLAPRQVLHPTPFTLHPSPFTLHPTPFTLHPTPFTLHPTLFTYNLHPAPCTLHPIPYDLHPTPYTLTPAGC